MYKVDGDIVLTTDNKYFINGSHKDQNIITYEKGIATKEKISKQKSREGLEFFKLLKSKS